MKNSRIREIVLRATFFLGPTGIFFAPLPGIGSLRAFYFSTAIINILCLFRTSKRSLPQFTLLFFTFLLLFGSASYSLLSITEEIPIHANPVIRVLVICNLAFGFYNISQWIISSNSTDIIEKLLNDSFKGFCAVFFLGLVIYIGYITNKIPYNIYSLFTTLDQSAYGYSRFSPGTYPNEFGIICSFYAIYALSIALNKNKLLHLLLSITFIAGVFLTSTRAAYITLFLSYIYLTITSKSPIRILLLTILPALLTPIIIQTLSYLSFDVMSVITTGYESAAKGTGSSSVRLEDWNTAIDDLLDNLFWGVGVESPKAYSLHNLPLQILYGLGIAGSLILSIAAAAFTYINIKTTWNALKCTKEIQKFTTSTRTILLIHVFIFGLTNHNQAHFFTWMLFALACIKLRNTKICVHRHFSN
ncbi:O-antigen ligase family protein [Pseudomonas sp. GD04087]|uniref:O-antigen ligase family protein n=1 Tax=unclassified Pseudomonas TaxID=196821 RepID=UPI0024473AAC|nr:MULTISPECIES: O-antigen ligase family protein [unclassified Pseudomonas]MDH0291984.1 O-antigen ligase family protein [Pseudomonas sp. GD04087]MDH1052832.1 O-antigen ligase family protein [Pseudomonas sp. GD03903]MDH2001995.1 O-antigen ligase family protein [Pseudomonas sp. GD03691]